MMPWATLWPDASLRFGLIICRSEMAICAGSPLEGLNVNVVTETVNNGFIDPDFRLRMVPHIPCPWIVTGLLITIAKLDASITHVPAGRTTFFPLASAAAIAAF